MCFNLLLIILYSLVIVQDCFKCLFILGKVVQVYQGMGRQLRRLAHSLSATFVDLQALVRELK